MGYEFSIYLTGSRVKERGGKLVANDEVELLASVEGEMDLERRESLRSRKESGIETDCSRDTASSGGGDGGGGGGNRKEQPTTHVCSLRECSCAFLRKVKLVTRVILAGRKVATEQNVYSGGIM